jgi:hypothetical protein
MAKKRSQKATKAIKIAIDFSDGTTVAAEGEDAVAVWNYLDEFWIAFLASKGKGKGKEWSPWYAICTRLQDSGWDMADSSRSIQEAVQKAVQMIKDPLGRSCMYQIINSKGKIIFDNDAIFGIADMTAN